MAGSKSVRTKMSEIIYIYNTSLWKTSDATDPAKCGLKRTRIEQGILDFRPEETEHVSSPRALMGLIAPSFLGTPGSPGVQFLPLVFGACTDN